MLSRLSVRNLAVVESAEAEFDGGLDVITGETGAGKSVLMGAFSLLLGARADASAVRDGAKDARIEAVFEQVPAAVSAFLDEAGIAPCEDGALAIRRIVSSGGGGRVYVNDSPVTVQTLRSLGGLLADVHGAGDHQSLLEESFQREVLDAYGRIARGPYEVAWQKLCALRKELASLQGDAGDFAEETERLRYSVDELDAAQLTSEDDDSLPARHAAAAHAAEILECAQSASAALSEADDSAAAALIAAGTRLREMTRFHDEAKEWDEETERLVVQVQELSRSITDSVSRIEVDPEALQALDERLSLVERLKRKYARPSAVALLELRDERAARLADLEGREGRIAELEKAIVEAEKAVAAAGRELSAARKKAGVRLSRAITAELRDLGFLKAGFGVDLVARAPDASGCDTVSFTFAPNPGESSRPLRAIASTGEIARVMLAVKAVTAEHDLTPTLVFDEIDSNIGGEVGRAVGEKLRAVAKHHQVIAITHLPQSAVYGERHLVVAKTVSGGRTRSAVRALEGDERVEEIARMLGGANLTSVVMRHARELLFNH